MSPANRAGTPASSGRPAARGRAEPTAATRLRGSAIEMLLLRDRLGLGRYVKTDKRSPAKKRILLELALHKIEKAERGNYVQTGFRRRRVRFPSDG